MQPFEIGRLTRLDLGYVGETGTREIQIDMSEWLERWPDGKIAVDVLKPGRKEYYLADTTVEDGILTWTVTYTDVAKAGRGMAQISIYDFGSGKVYKSRCVETIIRESADMAEDLEAPHPMDTWVARAVDAKEKALEAKEAAATAREGAIAAAEAAEKTAAGATAAAEAAEKTAAGATAAAEAAEKAREASENAAEAAETARDAAVAAGVNAEAAGATATEEAQKATAAANTAETAASAASRDAKAAEESAKQAVDALNKTADPVICDTRGKVVSIQDAAERAAVSLASGIEASQAGSGDPSPDNVRSISGWEVVSVKRVGKNLVDIPNYVDATSLTIRLETEAKFATVKYKESTQYTVSMKVSSEDTTKAFGIVVWYSDGSTGYGWIKRGSTYVPSVTTASGKTVVSIAMSYDGIHVVSVSDVQLEEGAAATDYEPYQGENLTAELPETVYGGILNWTTGVLTVTHKFGVVTEFNELYTSVGTGLTCGQANKWPGMRIGGGADGWCEMLPSVASIRDRTTPCISFGGSSSAAIYAAYPATLVGQTLDTLNAYVAEHPLRIVYPLANTYEIQLTPQQLNLLKGSNTLWSDCGDTSVEYIADTKLYIDKVVGVLYEMFF